MKARFDVPVTVQIHFLTAVFITQRVNFTGI